jgi:hypothetical protein
MASPTFLAQQSLDAQLNYISSTTTKVALLKTYARTDNYATVEANILAEADTTGLFGSIINDETGTGDAAAPSRRLPVNSVELDAAINGGNSGGSDMALALLSATAVLAVTDESSDRGVIDGDIITTFAWYVQASQPGLV